jgi:ABC-type branched-subunit amino acid transport system substrate-binding protein
VKRYRWLGLLLVLGLVAGACSRSDDSSTNTDNGSTETTSGANKACDGVTLEATETGVTADTITIQVTADTGSPLAPGLFQGNVDALKGFEKYINDNGGIGCRQLKVETWDSKLTPDESKNGQLNACSTALAMVGGNSLFNPDVTTLNTCPDKAGAPTGIPDIAALANDVNEQCAKNAYIIQGIAEKCSPDGTPPTGKRDLIAFVGTAKYYETVAAPDPLKGVFLVPGDLPTTVQSATYQIAGQASVGVEWINDGVKVSGRSEQSAYTPLIQTLNSTGSNYVYNGSNDAVMINVRNEAAAQNATGVKVWSCSLACYTDKFKNAGSAVDGTYTWMQFLPFEDKGSNQELDNYLASVETPDSFGAQAWMAAVLFQDAINNIVEKDGPNAITRANLLTALSGITSFDANGWMGAKNPKGGFSDCMVIMQVNGGAFERVEPAEKGKLTCSPDNLKTVNIDPVVEAAKVQ